jgi:hypothetical protein
MKNKFLILGAFLLLGIAPTTASITSTVITCETSNMLNPDDFGQIVWYNLVTPNIQESKKFYGSIFDWTFEDIQLKGQKFSVIRHKKVAIGSMLEIPKANASVWLASVSVNDIDEAVARYIKNGGRLLIEPFNVMDSGMQVIVEGPQGEKIAYINNPASPVSFLDNEPNRWIWTELWSNNVQESTAFYENVWKVTTTSTTVQKQPYFYFQKGTKKVAGMIKNPATGTNTQWVPYINMSDIKQLHKKLKDLEVNVMLAPSETSKGRSIVIFQDPYGATIAAQDYAK